MEQIKQVWHSVKSNKGCVLLTDIPCLDYSEFYGTMDAMLGNADNHCVNYFAYTDGDSLCFTSLIANDKDGCVYIASHRGEYGCILKSMTSSHAAMHVFEREIAENYGVVFDGLLWDKPLRFPHERADRNSNIANYPFYSIEGVSLHEVNVGPIHAGIIEPGVFRFICNGEEVIHLETVLGYQHRGVERMIKECGNGLKRMLMAESIAADSVAAHSTAYCRTIEGLADSREFEVSDNIEIDIQRIIAIEMERIAMHIADTSAMCADIGYQTGQVASEALRTIVINLMQLWCGSRFSRRLIRPFGSYYPIDNTLHATIKTQLNDVKRRYALVSRNLHSTPSVLARFEDCGVVGRQQMLSIGGVGMAARASGVGRDIRATHPCGIYTSLNHRCETRNTGDVLSRLDVRINEVFQSIDYVERLLDAVGNDSVIQPDYNSPMVESALSFSLVEEWRGEICHAAVTDENGNLAHYKIKDPSLHNWMALALSVRGAEISDFPICNKSFNLSYCGHDL